MAVSPQTYHGRDWRMHVASSTQKPPMAQGDIFFDVGNQTFYRVSDGAGNLQAVSPAQRGTNLSHASVASDGAGAVIGATGAQNFRAPQDLTIVSAWWEPTGADAAVTNGTSYRRLQLINAGSSGTGTTVLASNNYTSTQASNTTRGFTLSTTPTVAAGSIVAGSHGTVGGAETNGTVLVAGQFGFTWRPI